MALFKTRSAAVYGIDAHLIDVEVDMYLSGSARDSRMVGMPDVAVRESRERIKSALINSGFGYPNKTLTINLAPANVRKEGAGFDLPVAVGILGAMGAEPLRSPVAAARCQLYSRTHNIWGPVPAAPLSPCASRRPHPAAQ